MARKSKPDHAGRMPDHPRYGNPSDPDEEAARITKAAKNLDDWRDRYGGQFSGGVSMSYGSGDVHSVQVGSPEIAQKIVGRPLPPKPTVEALPEPAEAAPEPPAIPVQLPQSWFVRLFNRIKGAFR